jgi:N-acetylglucosamine transport system permease protein
MRIAPSVALVVATAYAVIALVPVAWMFLNSLKSNDEIFANPFILPSVPRWINYLKAWNDVGMGRSFLNSTLIVLCAVPAVVLLSAATSFTLSRIQFRGREFLLWLFLSGLMIPLLLGLVPLFALLNSLGLLSSYQGLFLTYLPFQLPFTIYLLYPFFKTLPRELEEAAIMDGCSLFGVFWRVMLPLAQPGLVTAAIFNFLQLWNEYILALIIMTKPELRTLPVAIGKMFFRQFYLGDYGVIFASLVIALTPVLLIYAFFHQRVIAGMRIGALKG